MARLNESDFQGILRKPGYGIAASGGGISGTLRAGASLSKAGGSGSLDDLESNSGDESLAAKRVQVSYSGKVHIRITFYRRRLADYSRAISEKALVDCLQYAGLISGDSEKEIWLEDGGQKKVESDEEERTELEIFYPEVDYDNLWVPAKAHKGR